MDFFGTIRKNSEKNGRKWKKVEVSRISTFKSL